MIAIIKNNFKLMFRSKMLLFMMVVLPILVIAALSSAFHGLLNHAYSTENFTVGYYMDENSPLKAGEEAFTDALAEQSIEVKGYSSNDMKGAITNENMDVFLYCGADTCEVAAADTDSIQARMCVYFMQQYLEQSNLAAMNIEQTMMGEEPLQNISIKTDSLPYTKTADAEDYYGIIEIIYFTWCGLLFLTAVIQSERSNHLQKRFVISPASGIKLYLGKLIPCELLTALSIAVSAVIATILFDIHWGNLPGTIGILFLISLAATALGVVLLYLVKHLAVSVILLFSLVWGWGFIGGSFETYMYSSFPESVKRISPLYYANRTIVEYSTMGHSDYTMGCIVYLLGIFVLCAVVGIMLMKRRMEAE